MEKKNDTKVTMFKHYTDVYRWTKESDKFITVLQGGTSSGKTIAILQRLCHLALEDPACIIHVVAQDFPNLRDGALADFKSMVTESEILQFTLKNASLVRGPYIFKNGSKIVFVNYKNEYKARSGKRDYLFINEAQGVSWPIAQNLIDRTKKKVFLDYNPSAKFWVHHEILGKEIYSERAKLIISNSTHNSAVPESIRMTVENMRKEYLRTGTTSAKNRYKVMGLGLTGVSEGAVFDHVQYCKFFPINAKHVIYGLDFGFVNNNTALVKIGVYNNAIYGKELLYQQRLNSWELPEMFKLMGISKEQLIVADSANEEAIINLRRKGYNVKPAKKGHGSINAGIDLIKSMPLYITYDSVNWIHEVEGYVYKRDNNGMFTNNPIDSYNDCFVAGTMVTTILGQKPIETIEVGEYVLTSEGYEKVLHTWKNGIKEVSKYTLKYADREVVLTCTDKHKIKTTKGFKKISNLKKGDILYLLNDYDTYESVLLNIKREYVGKREVFDLMIENHHEYFVDNQLVANCHDAARYCYVELFGLSNVRKSLSKGSTKYQRRYATV